MPSKKLLFAIIFLSITTIIGIAGYLYFINQKPALAAGTTINAASCSQADVQAAINSASAGDTINIPAGTCSWTCTTNCPAVSITKPLSLIGAGEGSTVIIDDSDPGGWMKHPISIYYSSDSPTNIRISGFTFKHSAKTQDGDAAIQLGPTGTGPHSIRIDHLTVTNIQRWISAETTNVIGIMDHLTVTNSALMFTNYACTSWNKLWTMGSDRAWYIEDSNFTYTGASYSDGVTDCNCGARYVFRHNNVTLPVGSSWTGLLVGDHGYDTSPRGCMGHEVYENTFINNGPTSPSAVQYRGGTGIVFNNTILGTNWNPTLQITNQRSCSGYASDPKGYCNGSNGADGNTPGQYGWPCRDQIGRTTNQVSEPLYEWNNCRYNTCGLSGSVPVNLSLYNGYSGDCSYLTSYHVKPNRDFFNDTAKPGYTPYTYPHPLTTGSVIPPTYQCSDSLDNDSDSLTDYPDDPGCSSLTDNDEYNAPIQNFSPNQIIEAESGQIFAPMQTGISGTDTYVYTPSVNNTGSVKFNFDISQAGQYKMEAKVNSNNSGGQNSFYVGLDNESAQSNNLYEYNIIPLITGFTWDEVNKVGNGTSTPQFDPMTWNLTQGTHSFTFYGRESNTWLDQIRLVSVTTDITPPTAPTGLIVN